MLRDAEHIGSVADLDDLATVHHGDAVADLRGNAQIVGDEQRREIETPADFVEEREHLRLHRNIEGRHRLIGETDIDVVDLVPPPLSLRCYLGGRASDRFKRFLDDFCVVL
ncbi:MAG: hypothetical protein JWR75_1326 [Devosia sp.]|nr:hypothetical protein [Devosia sp.]